MYALDFVGAAMMWVITPGFLQATVELASNCCRSKPGVSEYLQKLMAAMWRFQLGRALSLRLIRSREPFSFGKQPPQSSVVQGWYPNLQNRAPALSLMAAKARGIAGGSEYHWYLP